MSVSTHQFDPSKLRQLSQRLEADIHARGLREGDRYLTASEAARLLGVSTSTAHRTLRLLAEAEWVVRRQKQGTFVGPRAGTGPRVAVRTVHLLAPAGQLTMSSLSPELLIHGIRGAISDASVRFDFVPAGDQGDYVRQLLGVAAGESHLVGIIAVSCQQEVYRLLAEASLPAVVMGSLYLGGPAIPSVDSDHHEAGRLLATHLIDRGHRRLAICLFSQMRPGDTHHYEGVSEVLTAAGLPPKALRLQASPQDPRSFAAAVRHLLQLPDRPTALMTLGLSAAETAAAVAAELGLNVPGDVEIVFRDHATARVEESPFVHVQPRQRIEEVTALAAGMLDRLSRGEVLEEEKIIVPVELRPGKKLDSRIPEDCTRM